MTAWRDNSGIQWRIAKHASSAFDGGTTNAHGDHDGTADPYTIFTVTGDNLIHSCFGIVNTAVVSTSNTGTIEVGVAGNTAKLLAQTTAGSGTFAQNDVWTDTGVEASIDILATSGAPFVVANGADIIETLTTNNFTSGQIDYYCIWAPLETGASIVPA